MGLLGGVSSNTPSLSANLTIVAQFQPLDQSSLALIATLISVIDESGSSVSAASAETVISTVSALPNQPIEHTNAVSNAEGDPGGTALDEAPAQVPSTLGPLARLVFGLDEAFQKARDESRRGMFALPGREILSRTLPAMTTTLDRWSPYVHLIGHPAAGLVHGLGPIGSVSARVVDAALHALATDAVPTEPTSMEVPSEGKPAGTSPRVEEPAIAALASIGLANLVRSHFKTFDRKSGRSCKLRD